MISIYYRIPAQLVPAKADCRSLLSRAQEKCGITNPALGVLRAQGSCHSCRIVLAPHGTSFHASRFLSHDIFFGDRLWRRRRHSMPALRCRLHSWRCKPSPNTGRLPVMREANVRWPPHHTASRQIATARSRSPSSRKVSAWPARPLPSPDCRQRLKRSRIAG